MAQTITEMRLSVRIRWWVKPAAFASMLLPIFGGPLMWLAKTGIQVEYEGVC